MSEILQEVYLKDASRVRRKISAEAGNQRLCEKGGKEC